MDPTLAVVADGRLHLIDSNGAVTRHNSDFGDDIERRAERLAEKSAWKSAGEGFMGGSSPWGNQANAPLMRARVNSVFPGKSAKSFAYILTTEAIGAFLEYDLDEEFEKRVFHKESFFASSFDRHPVSQELLCQYGPGSFVSQIARMSSEGRDMTPLTEGDSLDAAPCWDRAKEDFIYYHSAGVAYDPKGNFRGVGPHAILHLDLKKGRLTTVLESDTIDYICPRSDSEGNLYFIKRPYEGPGGSKPSLLTTVKDAVLFPFRLLRSFVDFFQIFSMLVSKKPLTTGGRTNASGPEPLEVWIHGRLLSLDKGSPEGALAPKDWQLVRRKPNGEEEVLASTVLAYDLATDQRIVYSDGRNLFELKEGKAKQLAKIPVTSEVRWL